MNLATKTGIRHIRQKLSPGKYNIIWGSSLPLNLEERMFEERIKMLEKSRKLSKIKCDMYLKLMQKNSANYSLLTKIESRDLAEYDKEVRKYENDITTKALHVFYLVENMKFVEAKETCKELLSMIKDNKQRLAATHIENYAKLEERIKERGFEMKGFEKAHYRRLLLLRLSNEDMKLTPLEYSNKLLCHKWTYYLDTAKYLELYPSLFLSTKHAYLS